MARGRTPSLGFRGVDITTADSTLFSQDYNTNGGIKIPSTLRKTELKHKDNLLMIAQKEQVELATMPAKKVRKRRMSI